MKLQELFNAISVYSIITPIAFLKVKHITQNVSYKMCHTKCVTQNVSHKMCENVVYLQKEKLI